jgi:hypothetical protein
LSVEANAASFGPEKVEEEASEDVERLTSIGETSHVVALDVRGGATQRILYGGRWWLPPSPSRGESSESKVARGLSQHQKGAE